MHKVLIIDDEKDICFLISEILKDEEYITDHALNSDQAIDKFKSINPDLVIKAIGTFEKENKLSSA